MSKEITKPERVMYYEGSKMRFLEYVDQLESYVEKLEAKQLILSGVSQQRELLISYELRLHTEIVHFELMGKVKNKVDDFLRNL